MFYFTCIESKIYESFTFWNKLQEKMNFFHHHVYLFTHLPIYLNEIHAGSINMYITGLSIHIFGATVCLYILSFICLSDCKAPPYILLEKW